MKVGKQEVKTGRDVEKGRIDDDGGERGAVKTGWGVEEGKKEGEGGEREKVKTGWGGRGEERR